MGQIIHIRAVVLDDLRNGVLRINVPSRVMEPDESIIFHRLFPTLSEAAYRILNQETLLASVATEAEISAKATLREKTFPTKIDPKPFE